MEGVSWSDFASLFRHALAAAAMAACVLPLVGCFLFVRRTSFHGIALPQIALAGVACGFAFLGFATETFGWPAADPAAALADKHALMNYSLAWAALFSLGGLALLLVLGRRGEGETGRVAAAFALATASIYIFTRWAPLGKAEVDELLAGELSYVGWHELHTLAAVLGTVLALLFLFHRDLLLVSFDREMARVLGKRVLAFEALLLGLTVLTVAAGTMILGPTLLFGLLVLPPLAARPWSHSMLQYFTLSATFGFVQVLLGTCAGFWLDLPLAPAMVGAGGVLLAVGLWKRR